MTEGMPAGSSRVRGRIRIGLLLPVLLGIGLLGPGCREEEQDRPLTYDKGTYQGPADAALSEESRDALRQRATQQKF